MTQKHSQQYGVTTFAAIGYNGIRVRDLIGQLGTHWVSSGSSLSHSRFTLW